MQSLNVFELALTKEGKDYPYISPAVAIIHIQRSEELITNLGVNVNTSVSVMS